MTATVTTNTSTTGRGDDDVGGPVRRLAQLMHSRTGSGLLARTRERPLFDSGQGREAVAFHLEES